MDRNETVVVCAVARNVSKTIRKDFKRINDSLSRFSEILWLVVESDSNDDSVAELEALKADSTNFNFIQLGKLRSQFSSRTELLAHARNVYLHEIVSNDKYKNVDYLAIADLNNLNRKLNAKAVDSVFRWSGPAMYTANQQGPYYDIWALRHPLWSPNDCWEQLEFYRRYSSKVNLTLRAAVNIRMLRIPAESSPIEVESAFGGFAIVPRALISSSSMYVGKTPNGNDVCEHVSFCKAIRDNGGKIYVLPSLINAKLTDHSFRSTYLYGVYRNFKYPFKFISKLVK